MAAVLAGGVVVLATLGAGQAYADTASLRTLLDEGFEIRGTDVISADVIQRAVNNSKWADDFLLTLQRGNQLGFCHVALNATVDAASFVDEVTCTYSTEPAGAAPGGPVPLAPMPAAGSK